MSRMQENALTRLGTQTGVDMKTAAKTTVYTVPPGKVAIISHIVIRNPSASMAGGTDYDFGSGANADTWKQTVNLSSLTTLNTDSIVLDGNNTKFAEEAAAAAIGVKVITGSSAACTATIDIFGFEFDA